MTTRLYDKMVPLHQRQPSAGYRRVKSMGIRRSRVHSMPIGSIPRNRTLKMSQPRHMPTTSTTRKIYRPLTSMRDIFNSVTGCRSCRGAV